MPEWTTYALTAIAGILTAWITFRVRFERFEARDAERESAWWEWRRTLDQQLREREEHSRTNTATIHQLIERTGSTDKRVEGLLHWKHEVGEAYLPRAVDDHHRRLERIEQKLFNGHSRTGRT